MTSNLHRVLDVAEPERVCRLRELRMAARLMLGPEHPLTVVLADAIAHRRGAIDAALTGLDALPALPRRRLLATWAAVLPAR